MNRTFAVHHQPEFTMVRLGWFMAVRLRRWPCRGWTFAGRAAGVWLLRCGPLVVIWSAP